MELNIFTLHLLISLTWIKIYHGLLDLYSLTNERFDRQVSKLKSVLEKSPASARDGGTA